MSKPGPKAKLTREEREKIIILRHKFENRVTIAKFGKESFDSGDYANAVKKYTEYLEIQAEVLECKDIYSLSVDKFDPKSELTEMLMISHIYFELARIYEFHDEARKCLDRFVHFSVNQPYQVVNSELIRKYVKKSRLRLMGDFQNSYQQIYIQSKKCFIVTHCYGETHKITQDYRSFKEWMLEYSWGQLFVQKYYAYSPKLISWCEKHPQTSSFFILPIKFSLRLVAKFVLPHILKSC
jgi:hypothetical protein